MAQMSFREFVDKMLDDAKFRREIKKDPKAALERVGMKATAKQVDALKKVDFHSLQKVAGAFHRKVT
jgi:hypothetical protein